MEDLTFKKFREANVTRCLKWHPQGIDEISERVGFPDRIEV